MFYTNSAVKFYSQNNITKQHHKTIMEHKIDQLIELCTQTKDINLYSTLAQTLKDYNNPYNIISISQLNDLIIPLLTQPTPTNIYNQFITFFKYNNLCIINPDLDNLIISHWCKLINLQNWYALIIIYQIKSNHPQSFPNLNINQPMAIPSHHLPTHILIQLINNNTSNKILTTPQSSTIYQVDHLIINNKLKFHGHTYIQSFNQSIYIFIIDKTILIELNDFFYLTNNKQNNGIIQFKPRYKSNNNNNNNLWATFLLGDPHNITNISFKLLNLRGRQNHHTPPQVIFTSQNVLKLTSDLTPSQQEDSLTITKVEQKKQLPPKINKQVCKNKLKQKVPRQKKLNNFKPIINIESSPTCQIKKEQDKSIQQNNNNHTTTTIFDNTTTVLDGEPKDKDKKDDEEIIPIYNPTTVIPPQKLNNNNTSSTTISTHYTTLLQQQIQQSINTFTNEMIQKINLLNHEMNTSFIEPLAIKYQDKIQCLQNDFQRDTTDILNKFNQLMERFHWNEIDLLKFLNELKKK